MKKTIPAALLAILIMTLSSCSVLSTAPPQKGQTETLNIKVVQVLSEHSALALTKGSGTYGYIGDMVKIVSETGVMYDNLLMKGRFVLVGTYTYTTNNDNIKTVPVYLSDSEFKRINDDGRDVDAAVALLND